MDPIQLHNAWLTIGSFDGVHRGHQEIIRRLTAGAHAVGVPAVVLTFHPHPASVLGKRKDAFYLSTPEERADLLGALGVDVVITHPFNKQVASMGAREFMDSIDTHLHLQKLWVGHDFALGRGREGDIPTLRRIGQELGYQVEEIPPIRVDGEIISSSLIRSLLGSGDVEQAGSLLGRPYRLSGRVVPGDGRGRLIGVPTANLSIWSELMLPRAGVYVNLATIQGKTWKAVTNVGVRPTFETQPVPPRVEAHILDFNEDLYGQEIHLDFISRLRDELRFSSVQA
ncbi:MAG: riboflavin biosynthesis protein RibF, partial [Omnitrophica WOR_2 bacterium]